MPTRYKNLWTVAFSHCQALNFPFKKFVICHLSSSQNFVNSIFTSTNLWTVIFLSLHCQAFTNKTYFYFFFPFFFSNIWTSILHFALIIIKKLSCDWQHKFNRSNWVQSICKNRPGSICCQVTPPMQSGRVTHVVLKWSKYSSFPPMISSILHWANCPNSNGRLP